MSLRSLACLVALGAVALGGICLRDARANTWPPAPGTDMSDQANWPNDPGYTTDWNYWSWLPQQEPGTPAYVGADKLLGASGMHIDQAWTITTGRQDVRIQICDSGIEWDHTDLANQAYLNPGELLVSQGAPRDSTTGQTCPALTPASLGFDCNKDGKFNVADYLQDPRVSPMVSTKDPMACGGTGKTIAGDKNQNCILDPGDIIELFSDGVDDDHDGYTDDISGWDFYKNDNNPYDDTRYGHGSGEAEDSNDEGNNGQGDIGVCPDCRFQMGRVGDSFIAEANDFAKCVVFATDTGAKVVQEALGTVDQTLFSKAAIDYAYAHGVTVVASMADENSRHHNMPAVANHTLPVHAITLNGESSNPVEYTNGKVSTNAYSFIAFNTCSNYGGQNMLSVSGQSCSSEATGKGAGEVGLIYSEALNQGITLSAEEVMQLMKMNADLINVPDSRSTNPDVSGRFYESLPWFSQRFGYGRPNMMKTLQAIDAGLIPPQVDITSPGWFALLYQDRVTAPVPVIGAVSAPRAMAYDYIVEWAPGVEPSDAQFQPLTSWVRNVGPGTTSGGASSPLAMLTPGQIDTAHTRDPDSPHGENDRTITLRIRAIAHYKGGDVSGQARRSIAIVNQKNGLDEDLVPGFPIAMGASVETSPKLADIDGDGIRDVVAAASDGSVHVFSMRTGQPAELAGFPFHTSVIDGLNSSVPTMPGCSDCAQVPSYLGSAAYSGGGIDVAIAREAIIGTPAIADLNGDGHADIVVSTWSGSVYAVDHTGKLLPGWPKRLPLVPSCPDDPTVQAPAVCMDTGHKWSRGAGASPVLADFDKDGKPEIVQSAFDGNIYVWKADGTLLPGWPVALHNPRSDSYNRILSTPAVADFNGDGIPDVASGSNEEVGGGGEGNYFLVDGRGMNTPGGSPYFKNWPIVITSLHIFPVVAEGTDSAPAIADFTKSGHPEVLVQGNGAPPYVFPADPGAQQGSADPPNRLPVYEEDGGTKQKGFDSTAIFGPGTKAFSPDTFFPLFSHPAVGDVDEDGVPDVIMSGGSLSLAGSLASQASGASSHAQELLAMFSGATGHMTYGSPMPIEDFTFLVNQTVADISGDGYPEVIVGTGGYFLRALDACGCEAQNWPKFTNGWIIATAAVGDITGDHGIEVVGGTRDGNLFAWHTKGKDTGVIQWESFHHDNANTGNYMLKLDQGVLRTTTGPLDCSQDCAAQSTSSGPSYSAGGCGCHLTPENERSAAFGIAIMLGLSGVLARRRRRRRH